MGSAGLSVLAEGDSAKLTPRIVRVINNGCMNHIAGGRFGIRCRRRPTIRLARVIAAVVQPGVE